MASINLEDLVVFDLETTGLEVDCRIVQIAAIRGERIYQSLVNPEMPIPPEATAIHRLTDEDVASAPKFGEIADDVLAFMAGGVYSGFNIRKFDIPVLKREMNRVDRELPSGPILDLFELNQKMNPRTLAWFYEHYTGEPMDREEAHDAVYDCACTRKGFLGMLEKHRDLPTDLTALASFAEPDRLPVANSTWFIWTSTQSEPTFNRGKYRGWTLTDVKHKEASYLDWLTGIDADAATKNIIRLFSSNREAYLDMLRQEHPFRLEPRYLEFRHAMDSKQKEKFPELLDLATSTGDPSLLFLAAAWSAMEQRPEAQDLARNYLEKEDLNVNAPKRINFLKKTLNI